MTPDIKLKSETPVRNIHTLLFDLDNTLYPKSCGLASQVSARITKYMSNFLNLPEEEVDKIRNHYYKTYGLTLKGLMMNHQVSTDHYLDFVHGGLDLKSHIKTDERLRQCLMGVKKSVKRVIFSNADIGHCKRVTKELGIEDCFEAWLDYLELLDFSKPHPMAYQMAMKKADTTDAAGCVFFDDVVENLVEAKKAGMFTVLVGGKSDDEHIDYCIEEIHEFVNIFPEVMELSSKQE
ncbi:hypothetical protein DICPUDRAFT_91214 [Dictyostelium purpureum]|uniref:Pyrimidine 5-nucleotidase n=1 Tax=Dictyostelium purpureum TaxID=5786 RepID=F0Z949_DICPU|nr:uncharacterized protein DICPUDRAFT_91214 [Dictyostelium purpureum]EGC39493.1 hypothetical protein DICPUDRAFT_91214 [Dictyostelium purpureum]|eukprot:XP_003283940.1 hypothetical protein DICPUDRAFT_91214 [Dictyostelium purpureum]